jgi:hypothetical protein
MRKIAAVSLLLFGCSKEPCPSCPSAEPSIARSCPPAETAAPASVAPSPPPAELAMRDLIRAACEGRKEDFLAFVDLAAIDRAILGKVLVDMALSEKATSFTGTDIKQVMGSSQFQKEWLAEVEKGKEGKLCKWEIVSTDGSFVRIKKSSGDTARAVFETRAGRPVMTLYFQDKTGDK